MATAKLLVCSCCGSKEAHIADTVARLKAEYGDRLEVAEVKCLDVCKEFGAVQVGDEAMMVRPEDVAGLEEKVRKAMAQ
jgi:hypothetical protein